MNRVVLIGNGFDLAHGLLTKYEHFINWYWDDRFNGLKDNLTQLSHDCLCTFEFKHSRSCALFYKGWMEHHKTYKNNSFYEYCQQRPEHVVVSKSPFFSKICNSLSTKKWVDIENEYYKLLLNYSKKDKSSSDVEDLNLQMQFIAKKLMEYLDEIDGGNLEPIESIKKIILEPIKKQDISIGAHNLVIKSLGFDEVVNVSKIEDIPDGVMEPERILLLDFNYTHTTNLYRGTNCIPIHIHGEADSENPIIFGYGDELDSAFKDLQNLNNNEFLKNIKSIRYLESDNYRMVLEFIQKAPFQILIMGHSCGNSDRTLLNTLFEHENCISIKPYYHKKNDNSDNYLDIIQNISRNFTDMKLMRDRVINKKMCVPLPQINA